MCAKCAEEEQREIDLLIAQREAEDEAYALARFKEDEAEA